MGQIVQKFFFSIKTDFQSCLHKVIHRLPPKTSEHPNDPPEKLGTLKESF